MSAMEVSGDRLVNIEEILTHQSLDDLWLVVDGVVYDLTKFALEHPGGAAVLLQYAGRDATAAYREVHPPSLIHTSLPASCRIGTLDRSTVTEEWTQPPPAMEESPAKAEGAKPPLSSLINAHDFRLAAQQSYTPKTWAFLTSAATDCLTMERNSSAYDDITLRPRVLRDVSTVDLGTTILGQRIAAPIFIAPTSMGKLFHPEGERELGRGAQRLGIPQCVSTSCSFPLPEIMDAVEKEAEERKMSPTVPVYFQLYVDKDRRKSENLLRLVRERGVRAIFVTIDAPVIGKREADERLKADENMKKLPMSGMKPRNDSKGGSLGRLMGQFIDASLTWNDVAWVRSAAPGLPIVLKGIQTAMDAIRAMEVGVEAIYITNHGGRSLDTAPATILVLLELQKCCPQIFDKMEVYIDGGITRGTDIFKALCLGARAVGIGRGFLFALNYGKEGVEHFVTILTDELRTTMQQCGITSLDQVHPGLLHTGTIDHLVPGSEEHPYAKWRPRSKL